MEGRQRSNYATIVYCRQVANGNYPGWAVPAAAFLVQLPLALVETLLFATPTYFMVRRMRNP